MRHELKELDEDIIPRFREDSERQRDFTLIMPYYDNPGMFKIHQEQWAKLPDHMKERLHVIVVDDCSPRWPAIDYVEETGLEDFRVYRALKDIRWNWLFCRNLGVAEASTEWVLMTDIDHLMPGVTVRDLTELEGLNKKDAHRLQRKEYLTGLPYKPHPNTWFLTKTLFDEVGGYDERFSGFYGSDGEFRDRVIKIANDVRMIKSPLIRYSREIVEDASTTTYERKQPEDREGITVARNRIRVEGGPPRRLLIEWERQK